MSDHFSKNSSKIDVANADMIEKEEDEKFFDPRFGVPLSKVTPAQKVSQYQVKVWPTLADEAFEPKKNALGLPTDLIARQKRSIEIARKRAQQENEIALIQEACDILDEELNQSQTSNNPSVTVEELDSIRQDAYNEGLNQGHDEGFNQGLEQGQKEGFEKGYQEGFDKGQNEGYTLGLNKGTEDGFLSGQKEGLESGQKIVLEQAERFRYLADCLANPLREVDKDVTDEIAYIITRLVKVISKKEIASNADFLKESILKAIEILPENTHGCTITLNPDDLSVIKASIGDEYIKSQKWDLKEDESLQVGDIKVSNDTSIVDWKVDDRIDSVINDFLASVYPCVDSALREDIPGCKPYDEEIKKPLAPRNLEDIAPTFVENTNQNQEEVDPQIDPQNLENQEQNLQPNLNENAPIDEVNQGN